MTVCPMCGKTLTPDDSYCIRCGASVSGGIAPGEDPRQGENAPHADPSASLVVMHPDNTKQRYAITNRLSLGREGADVSIGDDERLSRHHLEIHAEGGQYILKDLGSANGTYVKASRAVPIGDGDRISVNGKWYTFRL